MRQDPVALYRGEEGIALVTTLVILLIMTVLGVGAVAVTALENRIAGFQRTGESSTSAAESCVGTSVNIIKQTLANGSLVPAAFVSGTGPILSAAELATPSLSREIGGFAVNDPDTNASGPDYSQQVNGYNVTGDIDFLYRAQKAGTQVDPDVPGAMEYWYRIDCLATLPAAGTESRVVSIYSCTFNAGCQ